MHLKHMIWTQILDFVDRWFLDRYILEREVGRVYWHKVQGTWYRGLFFGEIGLPISV